MAKTIILKNTTGSPIVFDGQVIPASGQRDMSFKGGLSFRQNATILTAITNGDIVVNDGTNDLTAAFGIQYVQNDLINNPAIPGLGATIVPIGTTAQRPGSAVNGMIRYNTTISALEAFENGAWSRMANLSDLPTVQARASASTITYQTTFTDIPLNNTDVQNNTTVVEHDGSNNDRILIKQAGEYLVTYGVSGQFVNGATSLDVRLETRVRKNDTTVIVGSQGRAGNHYSGSAQFSEDIWIGTSFVATLAVNDFLSLQAQYTENTAINPATKTNVFPNFMTVTKLRGAKGDQGIAGSGSSITVKDEGANVTNTPHTSLNFIGANVTATDAGSGQANITVSGGTVKQIVHTTIPSATGNTTIPLDNTTPLNTEGTQVASLAITPASTSNKVIVEISGSLATDNDDEQFITAIFRGTTCIAAQSFNTGRKDDTHTWSMKVVDSPSTTSATTYTVRVGVSTGNWYVNRRKQADWGFGGLRVYQGQLMLTEFS